MSVDLYTMGNMRKAVIDSATSEATGYPKENMADFNPDTYWKPTSTATQIIDIDFQEALQVDAIVLFINNYLTVFGDSGSSTSLTVASSPDDSSYTSRLSADWDASQTQPIYVEDISGSHTYRYWRITFTNMQAVINIAGLWLCRKFSITKSHQLPNRDAPVFYNRMAAAAGGRMFVTASNSQSSLEIPRIYTIGSTDFTALQNAHNDSYGNLYPLIHYEDSTYRLVRFEDNELDPNEFANTFYKPIITFLQLPYIPDGETY